jgi:Protein of unknown function (DUF3667)
MDELEKFSVAEGFISAEQSASQKPEGEPGKVCLNCGTPLTGPYCSQCGQKDFPRRQDIGDFIINFISSFYSFESKFFKTFSYLLFRPGRIINDYNAGKRESYYHPARMYVFLSFVFFLILSFVPDDKMLDIKSDGQELSAEERRQVLDSVALSMDSLNFKFDKTDWGSDPKTLAEYDSLEKTKPEAARDGKIERYFTEKMITLKQKNGQDDQQILKSFFESFVENIPRMIFLLLPIFALLLKLLYIRRDFYYSEHLVFSVVYYDFMYLIGSIGLLCSFVSWLDWVSRVLMLVGFFYFYKAMRKVYKQSRGKTILKFFLFHLLLFTCLAFAFAGNAIVTLLLM